jgi:hypothetical protein
LSRTAAKGAGIKRPACGECARQILVADEYRILEGRIAENVIGMDMRVDDVTHRLAGDAADRDGLGTQSKSISHRTKPIARMWLFLRQVLFDPRAGIATSA